MKEKDRQLTLPGYVKTIIHALESAGYEAYAVGGCVRDSLLGLIPADYDVTTCATPDEMKIVFSGFSTHDTGLKHGTLTVTGEAGHKTGGFPVEVTTFRIDGKYSDNRRPDSVKFTRNLREDLSRRDFTINALAYSQKTGITDYFGGQQDLQNKIIRAVGDPYKRFNEDGLRILRALRFAAVYGFTIEPQTLQAADELRGLIRNIPGERIAQELNKIVTALFSKDKIVSLSLLFNDLETARRTLQRLKYDNDTFYKVMTFMKYRSIRIKPCKKAVKRVLNRFGEEMFFRLADDKAAEIARQIISDGECYLLKQLAVKGGDLVEMGYKGKEIGTKLNFLLQAVIGEKCPNDTKKLLNYLKGL
jgi:tRNA nucleotidyltransferase (CCA-adding enzyme)